MYVQTILPIVAT